jgi:hypothetical protein
VELKATACQLFCNYIKLFYKYINFYKHTRYEKKSVDSDFSDVHGSINDLETFTNSVRSEELEFSREDQTNAVLAQVQQAAGERQD